jgi:rod shape-determining protein MreD
VSGLWVRLPPVLVAALVLHSTLFARVRILDVSPEILLLLAVCAGVVGGPDRGAVVGFVCGLLTDLFLQTPAGLAALAFCLVGWVVGQLQSSILRATWWIPVGIAAVASGLGMVVFAVAGAVVGETHLLTTELIRIALVVAALNGVLSIVVVRVMGWVLTGPEPRMLSRR